MSFDSLKLSLFLMRLSIFVVFAIWVLDKFLNPGHTAKVFEHFYMIPGLKSQASYIVGALQGLVVLGFVFGIKKRFTYGVVLIMHFVSTISSYKIYAQPWAIPNILFWAAFPMLAACLALYLLRDKDTFLTLG